MSDRPSVPWGASLAIGAVGTFATLSTAWFAAALASVEHPLSAVAGAVIDAAPASVKHWAIDTFAKQDKLVLGIGIVVLLVIGATIMARFARRVPGVVPAGVAAFAAVGLLAGDHDRPGAYLAVLVGAATAWGSFTLLLPRVVAHVEEAPVDEALPPDAQPPEAEPSADEPVRATTPTVIAFPRRRWEAPIDRRMFMTRAAALSAGGATLGAIGYRIGHDRDLDLRAAAGRLPTVPAGGPDAAATIGPDASVNAGVAPFITPNDDFYLIDTTFSSPRVDLASWRLRIHGMVDRELTLSFDDLAKRHVVERVITLCCVSNRVGGDLVGTARWLGVPLAELLDEVAPHADATQIAMTSTDGWTCGFPTEIARDGRDAMVAIGMNGEPLPIAHGFPARIVVPGLYGYVSATKWVTDIELTTLGAFDGYWIPLGWSKDGPVKTQSRIDVPRPGDTLARGRHPIAGVAWAQHRGIAKVEVRIDDGPFVEARLGHDVSTDTWRQWVYDWDATPGTHKISVRATDGRGDTQTGETAPPEPDGATGWHTIRVDVT